MDDSLVLLAFGLLLLIIGLLLKFYLRNPKSLDLPSPSPSLPIPQKPQEKKPKSASLPEILIFFGSQSGTAAKYSNMLAEEAENNGFSAQAVDLEEFEAYKLQENSCIFLMATYGEGDPTDNAKAFYKWLKGEAISKDTLKGLRFAVFGLGNTQYQHYNAMGRNLNKLLEDLGGERVYKYGEGDDNSSLEDDFVGWKEGIWAALKERLREKKGFLGENNEKNKVKDDFRLENTENIKKKELHKLSNLRFIETKDQEVGLKKAEGKDYDYQTRKLLEAAFAGVALIKETRQNLKDGSTLHIEIDLKDTPIKYLTAQNLAIFPENTEEIVSELAEMLDFRLDMVVKAESIGEEKPGRKAKLPFPTPISVKRILTCFSDFQGPVMKKTLKDLAQLNILEDLRSRFELMASPEGKLDFKKELEEPKSSLFQLIKRYKLKLTLEELVALTPRIAPRLFTISSSNLKFPDCLHITASLLEEALPNGDTKKGLISQYFEQLRKDFLKGIRPTVLVSFNESNFKLPEDRSAPVVMIGPGTGVAPFRAFLQEKEMLKIGGKLKPGDLRMLLFSGCRHQDGDYIYREEFKEYVEKGMLEGHYMAFSRDQGEKVYVQHLVHQHQEEVYDLFRGQHARLYICGSTKMGKDVMEVLEGILSEKEKLTKEEAQTVLNELETQKILIKELWG